MKGGKDANAKSGRGSYILHCATVSAEPTCGATAGAELVETIGRENVY